MRHDEFHRVHRIGWLRAAVLGANDGIVTMASLILGVAAAGANPQVIVMTGVATLVAGAMSMAAGEYVSVSSQADTQDADLAKERAELAEDPEHEHEELTAIYVARGLDHHLAAEVATQLTAHDALGAHARDELGIADINNARPLQAAAVSATTFAVGALPPLLVALILPQSVRMWGVAVSSLAFLAMLGAMAAQSGGASIARSSLRVALWGAFAMAVTAGVGSLFGVTV
jgi:VIT1/CCC1 family predicted Fe2+/Mn2+ transporter